MRRLLTKPSVAFDSRTQLWRDVGLGAEIDRAQAHRAFGGVVVRLALITAVLIVFARRKELFPGYGLEIKIATVAMLALLGWGLASAAGRALRPVLYRRLDPGTAGTVGFLVRFLTLLVVVVIALRIAGIRPEALAVGGAFTAVVFGLAAQQVLGNLLAGVVLITNRPFRVGERIKVQAGALAGQVDGIVGSLGLFYTTLVSGADHILVPNGVMLQSAVVPLREPERVELRARFDAGVTPRRVQEILEEEVEVPLRYPPHIAVEELDRDEVVVRIVSTPVEPKDGSKLAEEVLRAVREDGGGRDGDRREHAARTD